MLRAALEGHICTNCEGTKLVLKRGGGGITSLLPGSELVPWECERESASQAQKHNSHRIFCDTMDRHCVK